MDAPDYSVSKVVTIAGGGFPYVFPFRFDGMKNAKTVTEVPTYEKKSFKSYERVDEEPDVDGRHIISDDIDDGGGYGNE